jgi:hypothetical protein
MKRDSLIQLVAAFVMAVCLGASGVLAVGLTASGGRHRLGYTDTDTEGQPPQVALGIAMGAFRGLFVNFLWIRANAMKEDGRFYDSMDLARAITKLQPRYPQVWVFNAWNMAYNISVQTQTEPERWAWVKAGINLMRDEGLPANPNDMLLHKELGWIFLHKIGGYMDEANMYFKKQLAVEWTNVLGQPPAPDPKNRDAKAMRKKFADWIRPIAESPDSLDQVIEKEPGVRALLERLQSVGFGANRRTAQGYTILEAVAKSGRRKLFEKTFDTQKAGLMAAMDNPSFAKAWPPLLAFIRRRWIIDEYKMEPERMLRYTEEFGPIDWRHFAAHGFYWSRRGVENALTRYTEANKKDYDFINAGRVAVQSLQELWRSGDLWFDYLSYIETGDENQVIYRAAPNVAFIESYKDHLEWFRTLSWADNARRVYSFYSAGYENLMKDAIRFLYRRGQLQLAERYKDELGTWEHQNTTDPERNERLAEPLEDFVRDELKDEELKRPSVMREEIVAALQGAFVNGLLGGDDELFQKQYQYAKWVHEYYFKTQGVKTVVSSPDGGRMAQIPRDFEIVAGQEFANMVAILDPDDAERVYDSAPDNADVHLKQYAYDLLVTKFKAGMDEAAKQGITKPFDRVFMEPPGMPAHRIKIAELAAKTQKDQIKVEEK